MNLSPGLQIKHYSWWTCYFKWTPKEDQLLHKSSSTNTFKLSFQNRNQIWSLISIRMNSAIKKHSSTTLDTVLGPSVKNDDILFFVIQFPLGYFKLYKGVERRIFILDKIIDTYWSISFILIGFIFIRPSFFEQNTIPAFVTFYGSITNPQRCVLPTFYLLLQKEYFYCRKCRRYAPGFDQCPSLAISFIDWL